MASSAEPSSTVPHPDLRISDDRSRLLEESGNAPGPLRSSSSARLSYYVFFSVGLASLLPWNLFISASEFYTYQFAGSPHQDTFQNSFSVTYMVINLGFNIYAMLTVTTSDANKRIMYGLMANLLAYVTGLFVPLMTEHRGALSFYIVITQLAITAAASGILTNSVFALTAHFPPANAEGVMSGQAVAGIMATAAQLVTAYSVATGGLRSTEAGADSLIHRTVAYFAFAAITNIILTVAFIYIQRDPYYTERSKLATAGATAGATVLPDLREFAATFRQISGYANVIMLVFAVTLAVFPSVTALVTSTRGFRLLTEWHFFVFNVGDFVGRRFAPRIPINRMSSLTSLAVARFLFIPVFFMCHVSFSVWFNWITSDWCFLFLAFLLGATNGLLSTRSAMAAPSLADKPTIAGSIVAISISTGLAIGSLLSWPVRAAGCLCNPF
ncbi:hypothetical protein EC988_003423 [Linderina pennispora]|nr:hypothetical protein EC988_003423 [Linderina pennispora]